MAPLTVSNYLGMLQDDPENEETFAGLKEALESGDPERIGDAPVRLLELARGRHEERDELRAAAWLIEVELPLVKGDSDFEAQLWKELGRLRHEELLDDAGAREAYARANELRPDDEVQAAIERIDQLSKNWKQIAKRFLEEAESATDDTLRASLLVRAGSLLWQYKKKGQPEADELFAEALESDPSDVRAARLYVETLRMRGEWSRMAGALMTHADAARSRERRMHAYVRAARILANKIGDPEAAESAYRKVVELSPGHPEALRFLVERLTERESWNELVVLYEDALRSRQRLEDEQGMLLQIAMVHWRIRSAPGQAEPYFARLRKLDPAHPTMLAFYREFLEEQGDQQRLLTILADAQRLAAEPDEKLRLALEVARAASQNEAAERAIDAWKAVQRIDAANAEAVEALTHLYAKAEKWNSLVELLKQQLDALPKEAKAERVAILRRMVPIYRDRLHLDVMAINTYNAIVQEDPDDREALAELARTYEAMGRWNDLIQVLVRQAEAAQDRATQIDLQMRIARLWIERFQNYNQATRPFEIVLELDPNNREALIQLKDIYSKKRQWKSLFDVLRKESDLASDPSARLQLKIDLAKLAGERLHRHADAISIWREVVAQDASVPGALDELEKLAEREKDWATLAEVLEKRVEQTSGDDARIRMLQKLGTVYAEHVGDPAKAAETWQRVLALDPKNGRALRTLRESFLAARDWAGLEALYAEANDWEGLVEVLGGAAERTDDPALKVELSFRAASVYEQQIGEPHRAFRNYERILAVDPSNARAAAALVPIYTKDEKWARLRNLHEILLAATPEDEVGDRVARLDQLRRLCVERLSDANGAFEYARKAYEIAPKNTDVVEALEEAAEAIGAWEALAEAYQTRVKKARGEEAVQLRRRLAAINGERLGRVDESIEQLRRILEQRPDDEEVISVLDRLYRQQGRTADLRELFAGRIERTEDVEAKVRLLRELAVIEEEVAGDADSALARHRAVLEMAPADREALAAVDRLLVAKERWEEVAEVLVRRREVAEEDSERVDLMLRLAAIQLDKQDDRKAALATYASVLEIRPSNAQAVAGLERIAASNGKLANKANGLLEGAYERQGEHQKLATLLRARLDRATNEDEKRQLRLRIAELSSAELGDPAGAYAALEAAFLDGPSDVDLWDRLAEAAERADKHQQLAQAYATAIEIGGLAAGDAAELASRVADIFDVILGTPEDAEPFHERVLAHDPLNEKSFLSLKELYTNAERWPELQALYRERIAQTVDAEGKLELLLQVCFLFEEILDDTEAAIVAYQEVLELEPENHASRRALERLYRRAERWRDLATLLRQELDRASGQEALDLCLELGDLSENKLGEPGEAVGFYERILQQAPTHLRSQSSLERLMNVASERQRVAAILEPLYDAQGAWAELARVLEVQLEALEEPGVRAGVLLRLAALYEDRLHDLEKAFGALARAVDADPADARAREDLARIAATRGTDAERATVLERAVTASEGSHFLQAELLLELAKLYDERIGDSSSAERAWSRLVELDGENPDTVLPASRALERIHQSRGDWRALAADLRRQIRFDPDPDVRARLLVRLATLFEETIGDVEGAIAAHVERLDLDAGDVDAMRSLERLYERQEDWPKLISILQMREAASLEENERRDLARRVGLIYEEKLADRDNAIVAYTDVLTRFGQDRQTLASLSRLYHNAEQWQELLDVVHMDYDLATDPAERAELRFFAGELMRRRTGEVMRSIEAYSEVLDQLSSHPGTIQALEAIVAGEDVEARVAAARVLIPRYEGSGAYDKLISTLEVLADTDDPIERLRALRRAAEIAEVGLESPSRAFDIQRRALRAGLGEPDLDQIIDDLRRAGAASGRSEEFITTLREVAPEILDGDLQTNALLEIAEVARTQLANFDLAREYYSQVLEARPDHQAALDALEELHSQAGDHLALLEIIKRKTELAPDRDTRVELLLRQARLCETELNELGGAADAYEQVLDEEERAEAYEGLERLYRKAERWNELVTLYERQLDRGVGDRLETRYRLGRVWLEQLNDAHAALEQFREILAQRKDHQPTIDLLDRMMADGGEQRGAAAELLEEVFLARMDWPKVVAALEARIGEDTELDQRKVLLRRIGQIHEDYLEDLDGALERYARLFREDPLDEEVWDLLARLARVLEKWDRLGEIYAGALAEISIDDPTTAKLSLLTANILAHRVGKLDDAAALYDRALRFDPTDRQAFEALEAVQQKREAWEPLLELYREQVDVATNDDDRVALLHKSAAIREEKLGSPDGAIDLHRQVLEIDPREAKSVEDLDRLLTQRERWADLADHLRHRIDLAMGSSDEIGLQHRLAIVLAEKLDEKSAAIDVLEQIAENHPGHEPTVRTLEQMVQDPDHRLRITRILEPIYRNADQWKKLIAIYEAQVELTEDPIDRVRLLGEIARLHEERGKAGPLAFTAWARAFVEQPHDEEARGELDRLAEKLGLWDEHVGAYEQAIANTDDSIVVSQLLSTMARVHDEKRGDPRSAIDTYERLAQHEPDDPAPLDALEQLHTMVADWRGMVKVVEKKVERSYDPVERGELLRRIGSVLEDLLNDQQGAIDAYGRATREDDTDVISFEALDRLYSATRNNDELGRVLRRRIELSDDPSERVELGLRLAQLCEIQLNQLAEATEAYQRVLDDHPGHAGAVEALTRLYERQAMWPDLLDNLRLRAGMAQSAGDKVALLYRAGEILERELDDVLEAIASYQQTLDIEPRHEPSIAALVRISNLEDYRSQAAEILEPLLREQERWDDLARLIERKAEGMSDPVEKQQELRRLAEVHEQGRGEPRAAFQVLRRALAEDPGDTSLADDIERLGGSLSAWDQVADTFAGRASSVLDPTVARALFGRVARIAEENLQDDGRAIEAWAHALEQVGDDEEILGALDRLYVKTQRHAELADILERRVQTTFDPAVRGDLLYRLGELRLGHFDDARSALGSWQQILEAEPTDARAAAAVERLLDVPDLASDVVEVLDNVYRQTNAIQKVAELFEVRIRLADSDGERVRLLQEAAGVWEQELGNVEKALECLRRSFELDPRDVVLLGDLERLAGAAQAWGSLRGLVEKAVESADLDRPVVRDLNLRAASWYRDQLADLPSAEARLRAAIDADVESMDAHEQLVFLLRDGGREADLIAALRGWAAADTDDFERKERLREAANLAESALGDVELAATCHASILEIDGSDGQALEAIGRVRAQQQRWPEVAEILEKRIEVEMDPARRLELRRELAALYAGPLDDARHAMAAWRGVLDEEPSDLAAIEALEALYQKAQKWEDLRELLDRRLDLATNDQERIAARVRLARLVEQAFGRRAEAIEQLREILEIDARNAEALDEMERLLVADSKWDDVVDLLEQRIADASSAGDGATELALLARLADVHETKRKADANALEAYGRILAKHPTHEGALRAQAKLHERAGDFHAVADDLSKLADVLAGEEGAQVARKLAEIADGKLGDPDRAGSALRHAFDLDPTSTATRDMLKGHYEKHQRWAELAELLELEERESDKTAQKIAILKRVADIYHQKLGDASAAAAVLERASHLVPDDREVLLPLCDLYIAAGRSRDAIPVLQKIIESYGTRRVKELAQYHHRLGRALEESGDTQGALTHYDSAFKIDLTSVPVLRDLGRLCHNQGDFDRAQKTFRALLLQKLDGAAGISKADVYFYLGDISAKQGDKAKAISMLERAVAEQADHALAKQLLTQLRG